MLRVVSACAAVATAPPPTYALMAASPSRRRLFRYTITSYRFTGLFLRCSNHRSFALHALIDFAALPARQHTETALLAFLLRLVTVASVASVRAVLCGLSERRVHAQRWEV